MVFQANEFYLALPERETCASICARTLILLSGLDVAIRKNDVIQPQILSQKGYIAASNLVEISQWLSFRQTSMPAIKTLCGTSKEERRSISRGIKRVEAWVKHWSDFETSPTVERNFPFFKID